MNPLFNQIVGIDQTGALDSRGRFRPLYSVTLRLDARGSILSHVIEFLPNLDLSRWRNSPCRTLILVDAVLGLPELLWQKKEKIRDLFSLTKGLTQFGMKGGEAFFSNLYQERSGKKLAAQLSPTEFRKCDLIHGAHSLFRSKPYQRNVQTGTLRVWHELSRQNLDDVAIWPFDRVTRDAQLVLVEGYPTIFKNQVLPTEVEFENPNFRDAGRLAWGAREQMMTQKCFLAEFKTREGAIFSMHPG